MEIGRRLCFIHCLVFGALISPTDPIAVLGILKRAGASKSLATKIAGESLFNDGIAFGGEDLGAGQVGGTLVAVTYIVVVFSILVQGLSIGPLVRAYAQKG
jgi:CPA1 family monovalent cation:H+ antiporter